MPQIKSRYDHIKIYRPNGMRYVNGKTRRTIEEAIDSARIAWAKEFGGGFQPRQEQCMMEIIGVTGGWAVTILEV